MEAELTRTRLMGGELDDLAADIGRSTAAVFVENDWEWRDIGVPDPAQIAACVRHLIDNALQVSDGSSRTGRFNVEHYTEDGHECLDISLHVGSVSKEIGERGEPE